MATTVAVKDDSTWCARSACSRQCSPTCCTKRSDSGSAHRSAVGRALYRRVVERVRFAPRGRRGQVGEPCDGRDAMAWAAQCGERPRLDTLFPAHSCAFLPSVSASVLVGECRGYSIRSESNWYGNPRCPRARVQMGDGSWFRYCIPKATVPARTPEGVGRRHARISVTTMWALVFLFVRGCGITVCLQR